ncbi:MAG TPA: universal stress protein, partial [Egibacteraceae bacterium]|nr:universal stress protein [Egibacteraceae bacterium]
MTDAQVDSVLVPLDGSAAARSAIGPALVLARQLACRLELMTVYDPVRDTWERELDRLAEQTGYVAVEVALVSSSSPADVITSMAREQPRTLVCMATQGRGAVDRMLLGSVTSGVLGAGVSPVLLVGAAFAPAGEIDGYRRLVLASDGSGRTAATALPLVRAWVRELDMAVELLAVCSPSDAAPVRGALAPALDGIAEALAGDGIDAGCTLIAADRPALG